MSYDVRILVREQVTGRFVEVCRPERDSPTYNLGELFRSCMGMDWAQGEEYPCAEMLPAIERGIEELARDPGAYRHLEPSNGWGTLTGARACLEEYRDIIVGLTGGDGRAGWEPWPMECLYFRW